MRCSRLMLVVLVLPLLMSCEKAPLRKTEPDVIFAVTPHRVVHEMLKLAEVRPGDRVYDLGSGDGRVVMAAARDFGAWGTGVEIDPQLVRESREAAEKAGLSDRVEFVEEDFFMVDLRPATVVTLYLLPKINRQLIPKFFKELRPGTRIVSHMWDMGGWKPDLTLKGYDTTVYFWIIPADVHGEWEATLRNGSGERKYRLVVQQKYQHVRGTVRDGERKLTVSDMRLRGRDLALSVADSVSGRMFLMSVEGSVEGNTMAGSAFITEGAITTRWSWTAERTVK